MKYIALTLLLIGFKALASGGLSAESPFSRATAGPNGAVFLKIINTTSEDVILISAETPATIPGETPTAAYCEIHQSSEENGISKMRQLPAGLLIPAHQTVELKPGGYHIMLMDLKEGGLTENETFPLRLIFDNNQKIDLTIHVKEAGATSCGCLK